MSAALLARPEIRALRAYHAAPPAPGSVRLDANETPWPNGPSQDLNRYPPIRAGELQARLARHYDVAAANLLVTRGTSEAIDLLLRVFCRPGVDNVLITPPTFAMYRVYAEIQGAAVLSVPLRPGRAFAFDPDGVLRACTDATKVLFVCSPNNPTGGVVERSDILALCKARRGRSLVVVDEAYVEFSGSRSLAREAAGSDNLLVLRTLSKGLGLAGARCGALIGPAEAVELAGKLLAPYALSTPVIRCVLEALAPEGVARAAEAVRRIVAERERLAAALAALPLVREVWPSRANFLLVRFADAAAARRRLAARGIRVREFADEGVLCDCARITVGSREDNERLLEAMSTGAEAA